MKIVQHCKQLSPNSLDSPTDEVFRTPNTTLDVDDDFSTPIGDISTMKMKSMTNLLDEVEMSQNENLSRMKSLSQLEQENGDTPVDLVKLKRDFERKRFNNAQMQSLTNLTNGLDDVDGMINNKRHHSDEEPNRHSFQTPKIYKRVGNTKYVGGESVEDRNYQLMKMRSMGTINDIVDDNMKTSKSFDRFWNANKIGKNGKKYDKTFVVPIRLDEKFVDSNGTCDTNDDVFKIPENPMLALRKEKSSSCIESMRNRGSSLYDRLR